MFFFFKHKTAYELRISDWSSDVCSSDLIGAVEFGATYVYVGKQRATATSSSPYAILDNYSLLNLNLNWTGIFNLPLDFSVFGTNILDKHYVTYISGTYNALGFDSRQLGQPRMLGGRLRTSEEHTSELQSLIRISYAVFCFNN